MLKTLIVLIVYIPDISNGSFVQFQIWDFPGQIDICDFPYDTEAIFSSYGALIFVIDAQVSNKDWLILLMFFH